MRKDQDSTTQNGQALTVAPPRSTTPWDTPEGIATIKQTVAKGASDQQFAMFLEVARATGLNPFLREIWFIAQTGTIMAGRDGYLNVANRHPMFDGIESHITEYDPKTKQPIKAECKVWRKDRSHPTVCEAWFHEYYKPNSQVWRQYPSAMLIKVAEVMALKRSFAINGVVTEEEIAIAPYDRSVAQRMDGNPVFAAGPTDEQRAQLDTFLDSRGYEGQDRVRIHAEASRCNSPEEFELWFETLAERLAAEAQMELAAELDAAVKAETAPDQLAETDPNEPTAEQWTQFNEIMERYYTAERKRQEARTKFATLNPTAADVALVQLRQKLAARVSKGTAKASPNHWEQVEFIESRLKTLYGDAASPAADELIRGLTKGSFDTWAALRAQADDATLADISTRIQRLAS